MTQDKEKSACSDCGKTILVERWELDHIFVYCSDCLYKLYLEEE